MTWWPLYYCLEVVARGEVDITWRVFHHHASTGSCFHSCFDLIFFYIDIPPEARAARPAGLLVINQMIKWASSRILQALLTKQS